MVAGPAAEDAIERAHSAQGLKVGLHLVLTHGLACLNPNIIPDLVDEHGQFSRQQTASGVKIFFNRKIQRQIKKEIRAQFEAFAKTGLELDHVNTHKHMHLHPTVRDLIIDIGAEFGMTSLRLPEEAPLDNLIHEFKDKWQRYQRYYFLKPWTRALRSRLKTAGIQFNDAILGLHDSGHMNVDTVVRMLAHVEDGVTELYCHPSVTEEAFDPEASNYDYTGELKMLSHPRVKRTLEKFDIHLMSWSDLKE